MDMVLGNNIKKENDDKSLLRMLDRGIDDMEEGRELPLAYYFYPASDKTKSNGNVFIGSNKRTPVLSIVFLVALKR